jgi:UDP-N-acetylglucosamine 2-epimerase
MTPENENDIARKLVEALEDKFEAQIKEAKHFYGSWRELRRIVDMLEENEQEAHFERSQNKQ